MTKAGTTQKKDNLLSLIKDTEIIPENLEDTDEFQIVDPSQELIGTIMIMRLKTF